MTDQYLELDDGKVIGVNGGLPWHYSEDLKRFKKRTKGSVIIMGRKTWDSIGRKALPGRRNVVISRSEVAGVEHYDSVKKAIDAYPKRTIWVIGGSQIYEAAMPYLNLLDVTQVSVAVNSENAVRFPEIDLDCWRPGKRMKVPGHKHLKYRLYHRISDK